MGLVVMNNLDDILRSERFNRDILSENVKSIDKSSKNRIILNGCENCGKSILINYLNKVKLNTRSPYVNLKIDLGCANGMYNSDEMDINVDIEYYSAIYRLLDDMLECFNDTVYKDDSDKFYGYVNKYMKYLSDKRYFDDDMPKDFRFDIESLVGSLRNHLYLDDVNLTIDNFSWLNRDWQMGLSKYFDLFDKVIITNDSPIDYSNYSDYDVVNLDYSVDRDVVKDIVNREFDYVNYINFLKMQEFGKKYDGIFYSRLNFTLSDREVDYLFDVVNGNLDLLFLILRRFYEIKNCSEGCKFDSDKLLDYCIENSFCCRDDLDRMDACKSKLYI